MIPATRGRLIGLALLSPLLLAFVLSLLGLCLPCSGVPLTNVSPAPNERVSPGR